MSQVTPQKQGWVDLGSYNTLAVPARAQALVAVTSLSELIQAVRAAQAAGDAFIVLGEGSNTVFVDDYRGTVILNRLSGIELIGETDTMATIRVAAGENWHQFVEHCVQQGWYGLENLALIPGLVGAAPIQNIGAYGVEVKDSILSVEVLELGSGCAQTLSNSDCEFAYRESRFKRDWASSKVVTSVTFRLTKVANVVIDYPSLEQRLRANGKSAPSARDVFDAVIAIRSEKLPAPVDTPNAGSFFKNPVVDETTYLELQAQFPDLVGFKTRAGYKIAAAWLIDNAGWKNKEIDGIRVHQDQALVVINPKRRDGRAIRKFAAAVQADIKRRYGLNLEIEPRLIESP